MQNTYISKLNKEQIFKSQSMTHKIWGGDRSLQERIKALEKQLNFANGSMLSMSGLVNDKQELICSLKRYSLALKFKNQILPTIGIGAIYTDLSYRGRGIASKLIQEVLNEAQTSGIAAALLFTDIDPEFYKALGFIELDSQNWILSLKDVRDGEFLQYRLAEEKDIPQLIQYYHKIFPSDFGYPARNEHIWKFFRHLYATNREHTKDYILSYKQNLKFSNPSSPASSVSVSVRGSDLGYNLQDVGYISVSFENGNFFLNEYFVSSEFEEMFVRSLKVLADKHNVDQIYGCKTFQNLESLPKTYIKRNAEIPMLKSLRSDIHFDTNFWFGFLDQF